MVIIDILNKGVETKSNKITGNLIFNITIKMLLNIKVYNKRKCFISELSVLIISEYIRLKGLIN